MAVNITGYHNENSIIAKIQSALVEMLSDLGITGWQVLRANQPTIQALQNQSVYYDIISKRRIGTQGVKPVLVNNGWKDVSVWYEEFLIQVSGFKLRDPENDIVSTLTSADIIGMIQGCVNSNGALGSKNYFVSDWIQLIKSSSLREIDFETDSGKKEKMVQFDFLLVVEQTLAKDIESADKIEMDMERI